MSATTLAELGVSDAVVAQLEVRGIREAFPIQVATIEAALAGRDICGKAPTGSGKTLAFGLPVIDLCGAGTNWRPRALILAPTRELATQIKEELEPLATARGRSIMTAFGGTNIERDIRRLEKGVDILVACPGRLEDLIARRCCELGGVEIVVVDEADRMADMGFLPAVKRLLDQTPSDRHTLLFSATLDGAVDTLIKRYQREPLTFEVDEIIGEPGDVAHSWYLVQPDDRINWAVAVLRAFPSSIVFCRTRRGCDRVARTFVERGLRAVAIHGDRSQVARERALQDFIDGRAQVLVATDVAARGIHVDDVALAMHYDPAGTDKDYVHRSGRTGRVGQPGRVISMVVEDKKKAARQLQKELGMKPGFDDFDLADFPPAPRRPQSDRGRDDDRPGRTLPLAERSPGRKDRTERDRDSRDRRERSRQSDKSGRDTTGRDTTGRDKTGRDTTGRTNNEGGPRGASQRPSRRSARDWYPPSSEGKPSGRRAPAGTGAKRTRSDDEQSAGGRGTIKKKVRTTKGRHADKTAAKEKGKRRDPGVK